MKLTLDKWKETYYNTQAVKNAAIAQPVERILGKDEVASSNLASSSKKEIPIHKDGDLFFAAAPPDLNHLNAGIRQFLTHDHWIIVQPSLP